jgi:hypothetical protein
MGGLSDRQRPCVASPPENGFSNVAEHVCLLPLPCDHAVQRLGCLGCHWACEGEAEALLDDDGAAVKFAQRRKDR